MLVEDEEKESTWRNISIAHGSALGPVLIDFFCHQPSSTEPPAMAEMDLDEPTNRFKVMRRFCNDTDRPDIVHSTNRMPANSKTFIFRLLWTNPNGTMILKYVPASVASHPLLNMSSRTLIASSSTQYNIGASLICLRRSFHMQTSPSRWPPLYLFFSIIGVRLWTCGLEQYGSQMTKG